VTRWVLLRHARGDSVHFDWLIEPAPGEALVSFRLHALPRLGERELLSAELAPDHRPIYLDFEGPIQGRRGTVTRVARGTCDIIRLDERRLEARLTWQGGSARLRARPIGRGPAWRLLLLPADPGDSMHGRANDLVV
jgi:hypothetical protein